MEDNLAKDVITLFLNKNCVITPESIRNEFFIGSNRAKRLYDFIESECDSLLGAAIKLLSVNPKSEKEELLKAEFKIGTNRARRMVDIIDTYELLKTDFTKEYIAENKAREKSEKEYKIDQDRAEKSATEEEAKSKEHRFKTSRGMTFCQYCGKDSSYSDLACAGRKNGHNYVLMKNSGNWKPVCNKCGKDDYYNILSCS